MLICFCFHSQLPLPCPLVDAAFFVCVISNRGNGRSEGKSLNGRREPQPLINKDMMIKELLASNENANISVTVSVADLKEFAMFLIDEVQTAKAGEQKPEEYLTPQEVAEKLKVSTNTLGDGTIQSICVM